MKTTLTERDFIEAFRAYHCYDKFSFEALELLFAYFEDCAAATGEEIELDVIGICCEFSESDVDDIIEDNQIYVENLDEEREAVRRFLNDRTALVGETDDDFVYKAF